MSRQYYAKNPKAPGRFDDEGYFDVNASGAQLLGIICFEAGYYSEGLLRHGVQGTPLVADEAKCLDGAVKLRALTDDQKQRLWEDTGGAKRPKEGRFHEMTLEEFCGFIDAWVAFLEACGGYDTDPPEGLDEWRKG